MMVRYSKVTSLVVVSLLWCGVSASAGSLHCQSVNGNLNCAGSGGVSCQTVDGHKVCVSGDGSVVQSFGGGGAGADAADAAADDKGDEDAPPVVKQHLRTHDHSGHTLLLDRDGTKLHLRTDGLAVDRD
jgi:hypothetical protein